MKAPNKGNRPMPILTEGGGDYNRSDCHFKAKMELISSPQSDEEPLYSYSISLDLVCPPLEKMISSGTAKVVICIEQDTIRQFLDFTEGMSIDLDASSLRLTKNVEVTPLIVAVGQSTLNYDPQYMDEVYGLFDKQTYSIEDCQILAYGEVSHIKTHAIRGLSQIISICELKKRDPLHPFTLNLNGDKIIINANPEITGNLRIIQSNSIALEGLVNSCFAYPVFYMVLEAMILESSLYSDWRWYTAVLNKINKSRAQKGQPEFDPEFYASNYSRSDLNDVIWDLTCQLLTDDNDQLMSLAFKKAGNYAEEQ